MKQYLDLLRDVLEHGKVREDRTGTGTLSVFGRQMRFENVSENFPIVTTKKLFTRGFIEEMLWFVSGSTNARVLEDKNVNIWKEWGDPQTREMGHIYGYQWRYWGNDQLKTAIDQIKNNPFSRRIIVSSWNVEDLENMALPPCHCFYQFYVDGDELSLSLYIRSNDLFLGCPFNIAQYACLLMMVASVTNKRAKDLIVSIGDAHIYLNHIEQVKTQLERTPFELPRMTLTKRDNIDEFVYEDFHLTGYKYHPAIKGEVSV